MAVFERRSRPHVRSEVKGRRRVHSEDPNQAKSFVESTLQEIRKHGQHSSKLSSEEIDMLLGSIRRTRSMSRETEKKVRPPPPSFPPPPLPFGCTMIEEIHESA